jgi:hypothetical protein
MRLKDIEWNDFQRPPVRGLQIHRTRLSSIDSIKPCLSANAPRITLFQAWKIELRGWRDEVVALLLGKFKKGIGDNTAHRVGASVSIVGVAASVAVPTGEWFG